MWENLADEPASAPPVELVCTVPKSSCASPSCKPSQLEEWQELGPDGYPRCIPCQKYVDESHVGTADHIRRLTAWMENRGSTKRVYDPPSLPYLAWVPADPSVPNGERWLKCLLCGKYVQDETSHTGTAAAPAGSKEHQKNLRNYMYPGTPWYEENVAKVRLAYHPAPAKPARAPARPAERLAERPSAWGKPPGSTLPAAAPVQEGPLAPGSAPPSTEPMASEKPPQASLPDGWESGKDQEGKVYYFNRTTGESKWDLPSAQPSDPLPPGWERAKDELDREYYFCRSTNKTSWERPADSDSTSVGVIEEC